MRAMKIGYEKKGGKSHLQCIFIFVLHIEVIKGSQYANMYLLSLMVYRLTFDKQSFRLLVRLMQLVHNNHQYFCTVNP